MGCIAENYNGKEGRVHDAISSGALTVDTSAYTSGDALTDTYLTFQCATQLENDTGRIVGAILKSKSSGTAQAPTGTLLLFSAAPSSQTKNNALALADADYAAYVGEITFTAGTVRDTNYSLHYQTADVVFKTALTNNFLYGVFVITSATTFAASDVVEIVLLIEKD